MTPQIQQGFIAPIAAGVLPAAIPRGTDGDMLTDTAVTLDGAGHDFMKLVQDGAGQMPDTTATNIPTFTQPTELGPKAAVAMLLHLVTHAGPPQLIAADNSPAVVPPGQDEIPDLDLPADPANGVALPIPIAVPLVLQGPKVDACHGLAPTLAEQTYTKGQTLSAPDKSPVVGAAALVNHRFDVLASTVSDLPPPILPIAKVTEIVVPERPIKDQSISDPSRAIQTNTVGLALPLPAPTSAPPAVLATVGAPTVNTVQPAANVAAVVPQNTAILTPAPTSLYNETAAAPLTAVLETRPKPAYSSPAETAFRLRSLGGEINRPTEVPFRSDHLSASTVLKSPPPNPENSAQPGATEPNTDTVVSTDTVTSPLVDLADDSLLPALTLAAPDSIKQALPASAQPITAPSASVVLPPQLPADLISLAKSLPTGPVEILLNPQELGQLRFEIHQNADQLRVVLSVERPETMDLLRRNADQLLAEFRAAGFSGAQLSFGQWNQQNSDPRAPLTPQPPAQDRENDPPPPRKPLHSPLEMAASTGLNMRL